jgi:hypothetical protein
LAPLPTRLAAFIALKRRLIVMINLINWRFSTVSAVHAVIMCGQNIPPFLDKASKIADRLTLLEMQSTEQSTATATSIGSAKPDQTDRTETDRMAARSVRQWLAKFESLTRDVLTDAE